MTRPARAAGGRAVRPPLVCYGGKTAVAGRAAQRGIIDDQLAWLAAKPDPPGSAGEPPWLNELSLRIEGPSE